MTRFFVLALTLLVASVAYEAVQGFRPFDIGGAVERWWFTTAGILVALVNGWRP